ncbi:hypothetical protein C0Q70_12372 [Pomacea canaliculata]|uniref:Uncharacterized protein n=1 Tax=Pomacea canaliculata TaxID=400727 RepID=A0A2T7P1B9_POMCA|nr:hypothetical protein C0Q70_12372 [Pomacea canaliculata]
MSCVIKNSETPFEIQCLFPEAAADKKDFSVYFYSFIGSQDLMITCTYLETYSCIINEEGFIVRAHPSMANITVPDSIATRNGTFACQRGDQVVTCHSLDVLSSKNKEAATDLLNKNDKIWAQQIRKEDPENPPEKNTPNEEQGLTANEHQVNVAKRMKRIQLENQ